MGSQVETGELHLYFRLVVRLLWGHSPVRNLWMLEGARQPFLELSILLELLYNGT